MKNSLLTKITLACLSTILSLILCEILLSFFARPYLEPRTHHAMSPQALSELDESYENIYERFEGQAQFPRIVAVGDSFTNAGNVDYHENYPYYLWERLNRKTEVMNLGICEDTSFGSYIRIKNLLEKSPKTSIFVILIGVADMFYQPNVNFLETYNHYVQNDLIPTRLMTPKLMEDTTFPGNLKTVRMLTALWHKLLEPHQQGDTSILAALRTCYQDQLNKRPCLDQKVEELYQSTASGPDSDLTRSLVRVFVTLNKDHTSLSETGIVEDMMSLLQADPRRMVILDTLYNLFAYATKQSALSIRHHVLPFIKDLYTKEKSYIDQFHEGELDTVENLLSSYDHFLENQQEVFKQQRKNFINVLNLIRQYNSQAILMTYPLPYTEINRTIRDVAAETKTPLVDLELIFKNEIERGVKIQELIGDWEHCTPLGYELMAKSIQLKIQELALP